MRTATGHLLDGGSVPGNEGVRGNALLVGTNDVTAEIGIGIGSGIIAIDEMTRVNAIDGATMAPLKTGANVKIAEIVKHEGIHLKKQR